MLFNRNRFRHWCSRNK